MGKDLAAQALERYRDRFGDVGWRENRLYPGIVPVLQQLVASGRPLYVATSKPSVYAVRIVKHFELDGYFRAVFGAELDGTRSRKAELLRFALDEVGARGDSVMVGDREHDVCGAKANGMRSIGVTYGYGSRRELADAGADLIVDTPASLLSALG